MFKDIKWSASKLLAFVIVTLSFIYTFMTKDTVVIMNAIPICATLVGVKTGLQTFETIKTAK